MTLHASEAASWNEDAKWVATILSQDLVDGASREECYRKLMKKYWKLVSVLAESKVGDALEAEDIAQEAFLRAFRSLHQLAEPVAFLGWLLQIARNLATDHLRGRKPSISLDALGEGAERLPRMTGATDFVEDVEVREEAEQVYKALKELPEKYREVVVLRYLQDLDGRTMARLLGEPEGTVRNRLFRALEKLRQALQQKKRPQQSEQTS